jgi:ATP-dependent exoDNAse (exonuclease V) beta subunit
MDNVRNNLFSFPEVRVVEASAGSGKTYALAKRYVQLLINPSLAHGEIPLRHILAITFTNKATIEMKERILEFLKKIALDAFAGAAEEEDILSSLGLPEDTARQRAYLVMDHVIRNYNYFQVQTIDSFINAVVASCAFQLNLSARFELRTGFRDYLAYSLDTVIDRAQKDPAVEAVLRDFLTQYLYVENRLGWLPKKSMLAVMEELYAGSNTFGGEFAKRITVTVEDIRALKKDVLDNIRRLAAKLPAGTNKTFEKSLAAFTGDARETFSIDRLSKYFTYEYFPAVKTAAVSKDIERLWDGIRHGLDALCRAEAYSFYNCYIDLFQFVARDLRALARKNDVLFLPELNRQASELFVRGAVAVPELYFRLATRFTHFLIDEFQDTSELQWKNLLPMVEEVLAAGGSLFYVGDKKQAIYRFRGGDATLFDRIPLHFQAYRPRRELLNRNFRSHRAIVEFNNGVFAPHNLQLFMDSLQEAGDDDTALSAADQKDILQVFADSQQTHLSGNEDGYVRVTRLDGDTREQRNAAMRPLLGPLLAELKQRFYYRDIAVLTRDNSDLELLTSWLLEEKIPVESEKTLNVRENPLIKEIVSLLRFLHSPVDNIAFASFITGEMFIRAADTETRESIESFLIAAGATAGSYIYREFRDANKEIWDTLIEELFVNVGYLPVYELVVSILGRYKVMEVFPGHQVFVLRFLELVKDQEKENAGLEAFLDYFSAADDSDLYVNVTDSDAVTVLTIHKAKGLEFPVVIIPFLEMRLGGSPHGGGSFDIEDGPAGLSLVRLSRKYARYSDELRIRYAGRHKKSLIDELNAVYVGLTRAKCELYAYVPKRASASANPVRLLVPVDGERGERRRYELARSRRAGELFDVPVAVYENWIGYLKDEFTDDHKIRNRASALRGEFLHYALASLGNLSGVPLDDALANAAAAACAAYPFQMRAQDGDLERTLRRIVTADPLRPFFFVEAGAVFPEKEIVEASGATRRIDRLIVSADTCIVIDYKSSREQEASHRKQVGGYMDIIKGIYPVRQVRGYLVYLDTITVLEVRA